MGMIKTVPPRERVPPSDRVEADLRDRIGAGEWASGQALPSVAALAEHYGVSRASVSKALRRLADDSLVEIVPAWGTFRT
jgi:DNA-binding GntR family transcriptional regulator